MWGSPDLQLMVNIQVVVLVNRGNFTSPLILLVKNRFKYVSHATLSAQADEWLLKAPERESARQK